MIKNVLFNKTKNTRVLFSHLYVFYDYLYMRKLSLFLAPSRFPAFHLKYPAFLCGYFELEKMHSMRSAQRQVELRRLGKRLPVLGKANSLCKIVNLCVLACLFRVGPVLKISRVIVARAKSVYGLDDVLQYQLRLLVVKKY